MSEVMQQIIADTQSNMKKAITHLESELTKIRAGKATATMLDGIMVDYYGSPTPINQVANITTPDARTMTTRTISPQAWPMAVTTIGETVRLARPPE